MYNKLHMKKLIIANWKMNPCTAKEAVSLARVVEKGTKNVARKVDIVFAPSFPFLPLVASHSSLKLGAQDVFWEPEGAYTGEVSVAQLKSLGVKYVIIGHSERRAMWETNDIVQKKLRAALMSGMRAVFCVGELEHKKETAFPPLVREELHNGLRGIKKPLFRNLIIVYEPVWAVGTGKPALPKDAFEINILIRRELLNIIGKKYAAKIPILYGGSVDDKNAALFVKDGRMDGLLVGGASLSANKFIKIIKNIGAI